MTIKYQQVWNTMNELETVTSKICSAREILDCAIDAHQEHKYEKVEHLLYAVDEYLQYYLQEFDDKFKDAWKATVGDLREGDTLVEQKLTHNTDLDKEVEEIRKEGGYDWTPEPTKSYSDKFKSQNGDNEYLKAKIEVHSPYNDGWTKEHYKKIVDKYENKNQPLVCDKDDPSEECKNSWNDFWEEDGVSITGNPNPSPDFITLGNGSKLTVVDNTKRKSKQWILPVEQVYEDCFVSFPDDLLEAANLKEGDEVEWIDQGDGSYLLKKVEKKTLNYKEAVDAGWEMTGDGIWLPPQDC